MKVAINGFGRIGRSVFRILEEVEGGIFRMRNFQLGCQNCPPRFAHLGQSEHWAVARDFLHSILP